MYRHCIYCSAPFGTNEALERFPVGRMLAFDAAKGRLWAVCGRCARWNLSPIEERWEAVEDAERAFRGTRLRVQSENVGMAKLADGTRLVRVARALPGELAAWRYGGQLLRRRRGYLIAAGTATAAGIAVLGGAVAGIAVVGGAVALTAPGSINGLSQIWNRKQQRKVVYRLGPAESPTGSELLVRRWEASGAVLREAADGGISLLVPASSRKYVKVDGWGWPKFTDPPVELPDAHARVFLGRAMVHLNAGGASRKRLQSAVGMLSDAGSAEGFLRRAAAEGRSLGKRQDMPDRHLRPEGTLALEMSLHEESERRAMEGELALLEAAWRDAEHIAAIADGLAGDVPARLGPAEG